MSWIPNWSKLFGPTYVVNEVHFRVYTDVIILKILEKLGQCETEAQLDECLSLLGNSFTNTFTKFIHDIGDKKSTSLEAVIKVCKGKSHDVVVKYMTELQKTVCISFETSAPLTSSKLSYDEVFKQLTFPHIANLFGPAALYYLMYNRMYLNNPAPIQSDKWDARDAIINEFADIAWFIRDRDNIHFREL